MTWRLIVCLAVSALMHILILILPVVIINLPVHPLPEDNVVPVRLVGPAAQEMTPTKAQGLIGRQDNEQAKNQPEQRPEDAVSFEADGKVAGNYLDLLKARIFFVWKYPDEAIRKVQQGKVSVSFVLDSHGELIDIGILKSSGSKSLDSAAVAAIEQASPFGPLPSDIGNKPLKITGHFCYVLD